MHGMYSPLLGMLAWSYHRLPLCFCDAIQQAPTYHTSLLTDASFFLLLKVSSSPSPPNTTGMA